MCVHVHIPISKTIRQEPAKNAIDNVFLIKSEIKVPSSVGAVENNHTGVISCHYSKYQDVSSTNTGVMDVYESWYTSISPIQYPPSCTCPMSKSEMKEDFLERMIRWLVKVKVGWLRLAAVGWDWLRLVEIGWGWLSLVEGGYRMMANSQKQTTLTRDLIRWKLPGSNQPSARLQLNHCMGTTLEDAPDCTLNLRVAVWWD